MRKVRRYIAEGLLQLPVALDRGAPIPRASRPLAPYSVLKEACSCFSAEYPPPLSQG